MLWSPANAAGILFPPVAEIRPAQAEVKPQQASSGGLLRWVRSPPVSAAPAQEAASYAPEGSHGVGSPPHAFMCHASQRQAGRKHGEKVRAKCAQAEAGRV